VTRHASRSYPPRPLPWLALALLLVAPGASADEGCASGVCTPEAREALELLEAAAAPAGPADASAAVGPPAGAAPAMGSAGEAASEARAATSDAAARAADGTRADEQALPGGGACMYGPDGSVLYAPEGARCGPPPAAPALGTGEDDAAGAAPAVLPDPAPAEPAPTGLGPCMYGPDGEVLYAPEGADC
jgi:hypothetical protein